MSRYPICADVTFTLQQKGVVASNHRSRTHVWLSLPLFRYLAGDPNDGILQAVNLTRFANLDNHFADPSCLDLRPGAGTKEEFASMAEAETFLRKHFILTNSREYRDYFGKKQNILDRGKMGDFHQRMGYQLLLEKRLAAETLWEDSKLDSVSGHVKGSMYRYVQAPFMEEYFAGLELRGKVVLDFGCGDGMAAEYLVNQGAEVIGIDPDRKRLARASERLGESFAPVWMDLEAADPLAVLPDRDFDLIWMSDVFLLYFYPVDSCRMPATPVELLKRLTRTLKPGGRCTFMEPHGVFWLAPWLGRDDMPYTVLTEYSSKRYSVAPNLEELAAAVAGAGLAISRIFEPKPVEGCRQADPKAYHFADNFPQWWVFELVKPS